MIENKKEDKKDLTGKIYQDLKKDYESVEEVIMENENVYCIYADDETLWKMFEDMINNFKSIEFNAGKGELHYLRIII
jgi:hypothetical protein